MRWRIGGEDWPRLDSARRRAVMADGTGARSHGEEARHGRGE
jgi:hypothetical protein